jgi:hypothetical protein
MVGMSPAGFHLELAIADADDGLRGSAGGCRIHGGTCAAVRYE